MSDALRDLLLEQAEVISVISRYLINFKKTAKANITELRVRGRLSNLHDLWAECRRLHVRLIQTATEEEKEATTYFTEHEFLAAEEAYLEATDYINDVLGKLQLSLTSAGPSSDSSYREATASCSVQLPRIALPKFNGKYADWPNFKGVFESVIVANETI